MINLTKGLLEARESGKQTDAIRLLFLFPSVLSQSGWPTCINTHFFFPIMSRLVVSEYSCQVSEHRENLSKRTDLYSVRERESSTLLLEREHQSGRSAVQKWKKKAH